MMISGRSLLRITFPLLVFGFTFTATAVFADAIGESSLGFEVNQDALLGGDFQYALAILETDSKGKLVSSLKGDKNVTATLNAYRVLEGENRAEIERWRPGYLAVLTKLAYMIPAGIGTITESATTSLDFVRKTMSGFTVSPRAGSHAFTVSGSVASPQFDIQLTYSAPGKGDASREFSWFEENITPNLPRMAPVRVYQYQSKFGTVLKQKTSPASYALTSYYPIGRNSTLVVSTILAYVYSLPPFFGKSILKSQSASQAKELVEASRAYFPASMGK